ncbi:MAG: hypothetical protein JSR77_16925 [Planctomycetes bacterium]|nr:hypothetical protein [Planctomycetota bacterium]
MIRVHVDAGDGAYVAGLVRTQINDRVAQFPAYETFIREHVCIVLQNFGDVGETRLAPYADAVDDPTYWVEAESYTKNSWATPWLKNGANAALDWMIDFVAELSDINDPVTPIRFHFDNELALCTYSYVNEVRVVRNIFDTSGTANGGRWNDSSWKIEFDDGSSGKTLAQHWYDAYNAYGWSSNPLNLLDGNNAPFRLADGMGHNNRAFFLWYQRILAHARDYAMNYAAYDLIHETWPDCWISNYGDTNIPNGFTVNEGTTFGWQYTFDSDQYGHPDLNSSRLTRELPLGNFAPNNADYGLEVSGTYLIFPGNYRSGTHNAPYLYTWGHEHIEDELSTPRQRDIYEPHENPCSEVLATSGCDAPAETLWGASLRIQRHWLESILVSGDGEDSLTPWIALPGEMPWPELAYPVTSDDLLRQLCMLRAKGVTELLLWSDPESGDDVADELPLFQNVYDRVYSPYLTDLSYELGTPLTSVDGNRVTRTLEVSGAPYVFTIDADGVGDEWNSTVDVRFDGLTLNANPQFHLFLESSVDASNIATFEYPNTAPGAAVFGRIYYWDPDLVDWVELVCPDSSANGQVPNGAFAYYTPDGDGRRRFTFEDCRAKVIAENTDSLTIRIAHYSTETDFTHSIDLVQLCWGDSATECDPERSLSESGGPSAPTGPGSRPRGADFNYDGVVDARDAAAFAAAYEAEHPSADLNRDTEVNAADALLFAERYGL